MADNGLITGTVSSSAGSSNGAIASDKPARNAERKHHDAKAFLQLVALSAAAAIALFVWEGRVGLNIPDGGFFWYGVQRVLHGELPIRDFMAYDPGRYYWPAMLMAPLKTTSIVTLRAATDVFCWMGIFTGAWIIYHRAPKRDPIFWLIAIATLAAWMYPWFKVYDNTISIALVWAVAHLIRRPARQSYFVTGFCVGLAAVFGRNHGVYGLIAWSGAMIYLALMSKHRASLSELGAGALGVFAGFSPLLSMFLAPGFPGAFLDSIRFLLQSGATNMSLPVPYPWLIAFRQLPWFEALSSALLGIFFLWLIAFPLIGLFGAAWRRIRNTPVRPEFVAALMVSIPYSHYAYSRADVVHMAASISPSIIACFIGLAEARRGMRYLGAVLLCGASVLAVGPAHPGWQCQTTECTITTVGSDRLLVPHGTANDIALLNRLVREFAPNGRSFVVTPYWPGAYALFDRKSPMWATYALWPRTNDFQNREIERIKAADPGFVLINNLPLDGRAGQRFSETNPLVYKFIAKQFRTVTGYGLPDGYELFVPR